MKLKFFKLMSCAVLCLMMMTSCYTYNTVVGEGAKGNTEVKKWNSYLFFGLARVGVSDPKQMAGGAKDYNVKTEMTFVNGLLYGITFGIYAPTTTTVTK